MKPRYCQDVLGDKIGPPKGKKLRGGGLKIPCILKKWKTSVFECST